MCQLSLLNLKNKRLNSRLFLIMGTVGSAIHKDGWGIADTESYCKFDSSMYLDDYAGESILKDLKTGDGPFMGHIRQASPRVQVCVENSHPFSDQGINFIHNGKLTPFDKTKFPTEYSVEEENFTTKKKEKIYYKYSDSKIFFDEFLKDFSPDVYLEDALRTTMSKFYGKFAIMLTFDGKFYIARGKTADLYITYMKESSKENSKTIGYAINTSSTLLDHSTILLSNMELLDGRKRLYFTYPKLLREQTIFEAGETDVIELGEILENSEPVYQAPAKSPATWETVKGNTPGIVSSPVKSTASQKRRDLYEEIYTFIDKYALSMRDLAFLFLKAYGISMLEASEEILTHFVKKVIPLLRKKTTKLMRRRIKKASGGGFVGLTALEKLNLEFPWMMNTESDQGKLAEYLESR